MAYNVVLWAVKDVISGYNISFDIAEDKKRRLGVNGGVPGCQYYIPYDAKIGGL